MEAKERAITEVIDLAHYYILGATLLLYRAHPWLKELYVDSEGRTRYALGNALRSIESARKTLDSFEDTFIQASHGDVKTYDAFNSVAYDLIALNIDYLHHAYESVADSQKVFEFIGKLGEKNEYVDRMVNYFLEKERL